MILFDTTKTGDAGHRSGLTRVSGRLREELGAAAEAVRWPDWDRTAGPKDWFLTAELFSEEERPGLTAFLARRPCRCAAIFHDAIPLKRPDVTWPKSVARHPSYMKLLASFDRVWAVSEASRDELVGFWRWQGLTAFPPVEVLALGADFDRAPRGVVAAPKPGEGGSVRPRQNVIPSERTRGPRIPTILCVGIIEPRKNQSFLLDVAAELWREGLAFELHVVGRVNPHFGQPIFARLQALRREFSGLHYHAAADDAALTRLYAGARASVFPTIAEGCGLPLLESLWQGVPCVCSDLPVLRENSNGGGCVSVTIGDRAGWKQALSRLLTDDAWRDRLAAEARSRPLPTWGEAAAAIQSRLTA